VVDGGGDLSVLLSDDVGRRGNTENAGKGGLSLLVLADGNEVTRRLGEHGESTGEDSSPDELDSDRDGVGGDRVVVLGLLDDDRSDEETWKSKTASVRKEAATREKEAGSPIVIIHWLCRKSARKAGRSEEGSKTVSFEEKGETAGRAGKDVLSTDDGTANVLRGALRLVHPMMTRSVSKREKNPAEEENDVRDEAGSSSNTETGEDTTGDESSEVVGTSLEGDTEAEEDEESHDT
jgi:hypothetical protein